MASAQIKKKNGTGYAYLVESLRLGNKTKTIEKCLGKAPISEEEVKNAKESLQPYFDAKKAELKAKRAAKEKPSKHLSQRDVFDLELLKIAHENLTSTLHPNELKKYKESFDVSYVHNTTSIEGNTLTLSETKLVLMDKTSPKEKELREVYEVRNYEPVLKLRESYKGDLDKKLMKKLHSLIEKDIDNYTLGAFRRIDVAIAGTDWTPSPHLMVEEDALKLIEWYERSKPKLHPVELAARFHHRFEQIHPFTDGNGRVGRELLNFILKKSSFPPLNIKAKKKKEYVEALEEANKENFTQIVQLVKRSLLEQHSKILKSTPAKKQNPAPKKPETQKKLE